MNHGKTNILTIRTPEGILFSLRLSGPISRFLAWIVDLAVIAAISGIVRSLLGDPFSAGGILGFVSVDFAMAASILAYFVVSIGYGIVMEWHWRGQTLGKRLFNLRVMDEQGLCLRFSQIVIRNLLRFVDSLPASPCRPFCAGMSWILRHGSNCFPLLLRISGGLWSSHRRQPTEYPTSSMCATWRTPFSAHNQVHITRESVPVSLYN